MLRARFAFFRLRDVTDHDQDVLSGPGASD